jgi:transposase
MADLVERLIPGELWVLFRRMVPPTEVIRPQGGGQRRAGDRECLAAIIFVAASGCTWRQLPPVFGPAWPTVYRRFARWGQAQVWARLHQVVLDPTESDRPRQERIEGPPHHRPERRATVAGHLRREHA